MKPKVHQSCFISEDASIIGDVEIEEAASVWPHASIRADLNKITIRKGANVQDCCVIHVTQEYETVIGENVSLGHGAIIHGAVIGKNTIIGMNASVLDGAKVGEGCVIGANAVVRGGLEIPDHSLVLGVPGKIVKQDEKLQEMSIWNAKDYHRMAEEHKTGTHEKYRP